MGSVPYMGPVTVLSRNEVAELLDYIGRVRLLVTDPPNMVVESAITKMRTALDSDSKWREPLK